MRNVIKILFVLTLGLVAEAQAAEYEITINIDRAIYDEMEMVAGNIDTAAESGQVSRAMRKIVNGASSEVAILTAERVDDTGLMEADDGSYVQLLDGDKVITRLYNQGYSQSSIEHCYKLAYNGSSGTSRTIMSATVVRWAGPNRYGFMILPQGNWWKMADKVPCQ